MDGRGEVCLEEEVERLRRIGMSPAEIAERTGLDQAWVEQVLVTPLEEEGLGAGEG